MIIVLPFWRNSSSILMMIFFAQPMRERRLKTIKLPKIPEIIPNKMEAIKALSMVTVRPVTSERKNKISTETSPRFP
jgi:hypothetical protein